MAFFDGLTAKDTLPAASGLFDMVGRLFGKDSKLTSNSTVKVETDYKIPIIIGGVLLVLTLIVSITKK